MSIDTTGEFVPDIPGYSIKSVVGVGGFATVYLARQHTLERDVALKVLNPLLLSDESFGARFLREAQDTASVSNHPNIITIHDVGHVNETFYMAMQYLPGLNLKQRIESADAATFADSLLSDLAGALSYVHQKGFVHRDIKPANILFTETGDAVLSDFGVARLDSRQTQLTQYGTIIGTARYMSPEQSRADPDIDARSDLYSLGAVLFETLTGQPPFESADPMALMLQHLNDPIPRLPKKYTRYQAILDKLMAKRLDDRYQTAAALLHDVQSESGLGVRPAVSSPSTTTDSSQQHTLSETQTSTVLGATLGIMVLLAGSFVFLYQQTTQTATNATLQCPELTPAQRHERDALLALASVHQEVGRLAHPPGANALDAYLLALDIDPCNPQISDALEQTRIASGEDH